MRKLLRRARAVVLAAGIGVGVLLGGSIAVATPRPLVDPTPPVTSPAAATPRPETIVSLTFDDGWRSQYPAAQYLNIQDLPATFYINSDQIEAPSYLTLRMLRSINDMGHQIAGHTSTHAHLTQIDSSQAQREICDDRASLAAMGFVVTDLAYPYGEHNAAVEELTRNCGYNSGRATSGLYNSKTDCGDCPVTEGIPLDHRFNIRTGLTVQQPEPLARLKAQVTRALPKGGWLPLTFHHICQSGEDCTGEGIPLSDFIRFVDWLKEQPVSVQTVGQVTGGSVKDVTGAVTPHVQAILAKEAPPVGGTSSDAPPLSKAIAFRVFGVGIGQPQVIGAGIALTLVFVISFRLGTRHQRYKG